MFGIAYGLGSITIIFILMPKGGQLALPLQNYICNSKKFSSLHHEIQDVCSLVTSWIASYCTPMCIKIYKYGKCTSPTSISILSLVPQIPYIENEHISGNLI